MQRPSFARGHGHFSWDDYPRPQPACLWLWGYTCVTPQDSVRGAWGSQELPEQHGGACVQGLCGSGVPLSGTVWWKSMGGALFLGSRIPPTCCSQPVQCIFPRYPGPKMELQPPPLLSSLYPPPLPPSYFLYPLSPHLPSSFPSLSPLFPLPAQPQKQPGEMAMGCH